MKFKTISSYPYKLKIYNFFNFFYIYFFFVYHNIHIFILSLKNQVFEQVHVQSKHVCDSFCTQIAYICILFYFSFWSLILFHFCRNLLQNNNNKKKHTHTKYLIVRTGTCLHIVDTFL